MKWSSEMKNNINIINDNDEWSIINEKMMILMINDNSDSNNGVMMNNINDNMIMIMNEGNEWQWNNDINNDEIIMIN